MISFLAPGALLGLLALAVPAVLHLRRPPPPTVGIGSLRHLDALPRRRVQWWRWRDLARLALRLALLALLVAALARPLWRRSADDHAPQRWSLVDPSGTPAGPSRERLDARRAAGDAVRLLADGFPAFRPDVVAAAPVNVWSLLRELDARLPAGSSLTVFSPARLDSLRGERPALGNVAVDWVETPLVEAPQPTSAKAVARMGSALRVLIFHAPDRVADANRLAAAVRVAAPPTPTRPEAVVTINPNSNGAPRAAPADWAFCLGGIRPEALAGEAGATVARNLFTDAGDVPPAEDGAGPGWLVAPELAGGPGILVRRRVDLSPETAAAVHWTDSAGRPVLTVARGEEAGQRRWRFGSRFNPAWNDLPATTALAEVLRAWFFQPPADAPDLRLAGAAQALPQKGKAGARAVPWPWAGEDDAVADPAVDLRSWALGLAAIGFLLERFWALRRDPGRPPVAVAAR